jgi:hypothetical protein
MVDGHIEVRQLVENEHSEVGHDQQDVDHREPARGQTIGQQKHQADRSAGPSRSIVVALVLLAVLRLTRRFLNRRRLAAWEAAWPAIGPRWTGYRP